MFYINPLREEVVHLHPRIVIYHNIITDAEIAVIKELAIPKVDQLSISRNSYTTRHRRYLNVYLHCNIHYTCLPLM